MQHAQQLEDLAYGLGRRFAEERDRLQDTAKALATEIDAHKAAALGEIARAIAGVKDGEPGPKGEPGEKGDRGEAAEPLALSPEFAGLVDETVKTVLDQVREDRLELAEQMFAATKRFDRLATEFEERLASLKDGEPGAPGPEGAPGRDGITGEARGKYDERENYQKHDRVAHNGSEWIAKRDNPGPLPGEGWMLGAQGKSGKPGEPGVGIRRAVTKDYALVLELTDGKAMTIDLRGMFERYDQERGA